MKLRNYTSTYLRWQVDVDYLDTLDAASKAFLEAYIRSEVQGDHRPFAALGVEIPTEKKREIERRKYRQKMDAMSRFPTHLDE